MHPCRLDISQLPPHGLIGIDGDPGAGKTTLSRQIASKQFRAIISLDDFLLENGRPFLEQLQLSHLRRALDICGGNAIVEGVHLLEALSVVDQKPNHLVFCKLIMRGEWPLSPEQPFTPKAKLTASVLAYYRAHKPWLQAHQIIEREVH